MTDSQFWNVHIQRVPWTIHGENQLTTDLAVWWLTMLAMSDCQHRELVAEHEMVSINQWSDASDLQDGRGWMQTHRYSKFEKRVLPPVPVQLVNNDDTGTDVDTGTDIVIGTDTDMGMGMAMATVTGIGAGMDMRIGFGFGINIDFRNVSASTPPDLDPGIFQ